MFIAEIRLYRGRNPTVEQMKYIDNKMIRVITENFKKQFNLKVDIELKKLVTAVVASEQFAK